MSNEVPSAPLMFDDYNLMVSAPREFPVRFIYGSLAMENEAFYPFPVRSVVNFGWGWASDSELFSIDKAKPLGFDFSWFSFSENAFYHVREKFTPIHFEILQTRLNSLVEQSQNTYKEIVFGVLPKGKISVWYGHGDIRIELANFTGKEVELDWSKVFPVAKFREAYVKQTLMSREGLIFNEQSEKSIKFWQLYGGKYSIDFRVLGLENSKNTFQLYNGEKLPYAGGEGYFSEILSSLPSIVEVRWEDDRSRKLAVISFKQDNILDVIGSTKFQKSSRKQLTIAIEPSAPASKVLLLMDSDVYEITKYEDEFYIDD